MREKEKVFNLNHIKVKLKTLDMYFSEFNFQFNLFFNCKSKSTEFNLVSIFDLKTGHILIIALFIGPNIRTLGVYL